MTAPSGSSTEAPATDAPTAPKNARASWPAERFFDLLGELGRLRVISICGPSVFESLCEAGPYEIADGYLNMITEAFHWHVALDSFGHVLSKDTTHGRSGRNVLFFELRQHAGSTPFLRIYVYRPLETEFAPEIAAAFHRAHAELQHGVAITHGEQ